jgi:hypothetical protein
VVIGAGEHTLDLFWHLNPDLQDQKGVFSDHGGQNCLRILSVEDDAWKRQVRPGWWSPVYGKKEPAPVLHFSTVAKLPAEFVTLLVPGATASRSGHLTRVARTDQCAYLYETTGEKHLMVFGSRGESWTMSPWSSDAEFMYAGQEGDQKILILCNAHYLEWGGKKVISSASPMLRCEILMDKASVKAVCVNENAVIMKDVIRALWAESDTDPNMPLSKGTVT